MISRSVSWLAKIGFRSRVQTVRKIIIDLNPTATVGKCAGVVLCGLWSGELCEPLAPGAMINFLLGVAELRPPFLLTRVISFEDSLLPALQRKRKRNSSYIQQVKMKLPGKC